MSMILFPTSVICELVVGGGGGDGIGLGVGESAGEGDGLGVEGEEGLLGPIETMILMSELPRIPFSMPDIWIVKESCP
jgi:hypothetical protein